MITQEREEAFDHLLFFENLKQILFSQAGLSCQYFKLRGISSCDVASSRTLASIST